MVQGAGSERRTYEVRACAALHRIVTGSEARPISPAVTLPVVPIEIGARSKPGCTVAEHPAGGWEPAEMSWPPLLTYSFPDAVVQGEEGIAIVGDRYIVEESLRLCHFHEGGALWEADHRVSLPVIEPGIGVDVGQSLASGHPGNRNYAHWLVDVLPGCHAPFTEPDAILIWPKIRNRYQAQSIEALSQGTRSVFVEPDGAVRCRRLFVNPSYLPNPGHLPHPGRMAMIERLRALAGYDPGARRRIVVSRKDAGARIFLQEDAMIERAIADGFEVHTLSDKNFAEQVRLFAESEIVIGAHGAGMANVIFCRPGALFIELFYKTYVQWSMRRLASVVPLRYGCLIGDEVGGEAGPWAKEWSIDPSELNALFDRLQDETVILR